MAEDHAGPAGQDNDGEAKPGDEYRFAAGPADGDAAVVDGQIVDEPDEVLGTIVSDDGSPTFEEIRFRLTATNGGEPRGVRRGRGPRPRRDPGLLGAVPGAGRARGQPPRGSAERDRTRRAPLRWRLRPRGRVHHHLPARAVRAHRGAARRERWHRGPRRDPDSAPRRGSRAPAAPGHDHRRDGLPARSGPGPAHRVTCTATARSRSPSTTARCSGTC